MQTCIFTLGILLAGQMSDSGGTRYPLVPPPAAGGSMGVVHPPAAQQPWAGETTDHVPPVEGHHHGATVPPTVSPMLEQSERALPPMTEPARTPPAATPPSGRNSGVGLTKVNRSAELLRNLAKPVGNEKLVGVPLSLGDAVQNAASRAEQTERVKLYWELSEAVTDFHLTSLEEIELQSLRNGIGQAGQAWGQAQQTGTARKRVARSTVEVAQLRLQKELRLSDQSNLPLPSDLPHCGAYETKYEQIFSGRSSREAEQLGELLSLRHKELGQRAVASMTAREWLILVSKQRSAQSDGTQLLKAYENLALQRREFVSTAYQYNASIARYTELAVPQNIGAIRLVAMLIQTDGNSAKDWQRGSIRRTNAEEAVPRNETGRSPRRTFADGRRNEVRRVPAVEREGEHSILVKPSP